MDAHGNLFIADAANNVVEEVTPAGRLSVVAGVAGKQGRPTPGPAARSEALACPSGVALDARGDLFIAGHGQLRRGREHFRPGILAVVAGRWSVGGGPPTPGSATQFKDFDFEPRGLAVDAHGLCRRRRREGDVLTRRRPALGRRGEGADL